MGEPKILTYIPLLVDRGAHLDAVNGNGQTAYDICTRQHIKRRLKPPQPSSLICLASHAIVAGGIDYQNMASVPPTLKAYIRLHDPKAPRANYYHSLYSHASIRGNDYAYMCMCSAHSVEYISIYIIPVLILYFINCTCTCMHFYEHCSEGFVMGNHLEYY